MSNVRGRRKLKSVSALESIGETEQEQASRKYLSPLQPSADNPASLVGCGVTSTFQKVGKFKTVARLKENSPMKLRRSKRKPLGSSSEEFKAKSSTPKEEENINLKQQTLTKYSRKLATKLRGSNLVQQEENQKVVLEHHEASLSGISIPSESSGYLSDGAEKPESCLKSGPKTESKTTVKAAQDEHLSPPKKEDSIAEVNQGLQNCHSVPKEVYDLLISDTVPESYWKELAEQRRLALEETLHENEMLRDQLEVLEAEYTRLKQVVDDAEKLTEVVKDIIDS